MNRRRFFQLAGVACAAGAATLTVSSAAGRTYFEDETVYGSDFGSSVRGLTFVRCHFAEPMRCHSLQWCHFYNCTFDDVLIEQKGPTKLALIHCFFKFPGDDNTGFANVGIRGHFTQWRGQP